ncbi:spermidine/putrescine transport system ATP-binding protein [Paenibacillus sp. OK060]|uniref:ABC transporter ATP-binding protein n=1 Tax=Paenibacillus sp. OK060 TaxID=1881034 RepID=UPI0008883006|nr:ABC transporter ATP-binding protein [Paenibacillus sp. OK060]SDK23986.1 spermidine/putrescine transport system ATP-binding protein [Paenibacillus sp. OK060]
MSSEQELISIETREVTKTYGERAAVNHVSLQVKKGEFVSLLGPSGCGKTTLLRMLGGLEQPDQGCIMLGGRDVTGIPAYGRNSNMIFQQLALFPHMDVFNNIAYGLKVKKLPKADIRKQVHEMLELVQLGDYGRRAVSQLSGGQAQRVAIARALINRPEVLLLDEPLSALDMQLRLDMQRELKRIQREFGGTFIFVTHDQNEAMNMSDRIGVMRAGKLLQYATPDEIYERPADSFVAKFIGDTNLLATTVLGQDTNVIRVECFGYSLLVKTNENTPFALIGDRHSLSIRNEYIRLGEDANPCLNKLDGRVIEAVYGGANIRYTIQIAEGFLVQASVLHQRGASRFSPGEPIQIGFDPEDALLLSEPLLLNPVQEEGI